MALTITAKPVYAGVTTEISRIEFEIRGFRSRPGGLRLACRVAPSHTDIHEAVRAAQLSLLEDLADLHSAIAEGQFDVVPGR